MNSLTLTKTQSHHNHHNTTRATREHIPLRTVCLHKHITYIALYQRTGTPTVTEQQILNILQGNVLTQATRSEPDTVTMPRMMEHPLPLSSGPSRSALQTSTFTRTNVASTPSSIGRVVESIDLVQQLIRTRREERDNHQASLTQQPQPTQPMQVDMEPTQPTQGDPSPRNSPRGSHQTDPGVPVIYDGMDDSCSICQEAFTHGDRVCRLSCRHMFHSACWERAQQTHNTSVPVPTTPLYCPNCRGAGKCDCSVELH